MTTPELGADLHYKHLSAALLEQGQINFSRLKKAGQNVCGRSRAFIGLFLGELIVYWLWLRRFNALLFGSVKDWGAGKPDPTIG